MYSDQQARLLPDLQTGEKVRIQRGVTWQPAVVEKEHKQPRAYIVHTPEGNLYRCNQEHLRKTCEKENDASDKYSMTETYSGMHDPERKTDTLLANTPAVQKTDDIQYMTLNSKHQYRQQGQVER